MRVYQRVQQSNQRQKHYLAVMTAGGGKQSALIRLCVVAGDTRAFSSRGSAD